LTAVIKKREQGTEAYLNCMTDSLENSQLETYTCTSSTNKVSELSDKASGVF